jgi:hypothetical protein
MIIDGTGHNLGKIKAEKKTIRKTWIWYIYGIC